MRVHWWKCQSCIIMHPLIKSAQIKTICKLFLGKCYFFEFCLLLLLRPQGAALQGPWGKHRPSLQRTGAQKGLPALLAHLAFSFFSSPRIQIFPRQGIALLRVWNEEETIKHSPGQKSAEVRVHGGEPAGTWIPWAGDRWCCCLVIASKSF